MPDSSTLFYFAPLITQDWQDVENKDFIKSGHFVYIYNIDSMRWLDLGSLNEIKSGSGGAGTALRDSENHK